MCGQNFWTTLWVQVSPGTPCGRGYFRISESSLWVQNNPWIYVRSAKDFWWWAFRGTALWDSTRACSPKATLEKGRHIPRRALCNDVPTPTYAWAVCTSHFNSTLSDIMLVAWNHLWFQGIDTTEMGKYCNSRFSPQRASLPVHHSDHSVQWGDYTDPLVWPRGGNKKFLPWFLAGIGVISRGIS